MGGWGGGMKFHFPFLYHAAIYDVTFCLYNVISKCGSLPEISLVLISRVRVFCDVKKCHESF